MRNVWSIAVSVVLTVSLLAGCDSLGITEETEQSSGSETTVSQVELDIPETDTEQFTERDSDTAYDESKAIQIELTGSGAKASDNSVNIAGAVVTITEDATHVITGTLDDGMIIVDAPDTAKLQLVFDGVSVTSSTSAALYIKQADKVFITAVGENVLENGGEFIAIDDSNIDGAIFSKQDIVFNGTGSLDVNSPAGHGIVGKDDIKFTSGSYHIAASSHAIQANDSVRVKDAAITVDAGKDGIHAENNDDSAKGYVYIESGTFDMECEGDGISAGSYLQVKSGSITILAGGGYENGTKQSSDGWGGFGGGFGGGGRPGGGGGGMRSQSRSADGVAVTPTATSTTDDSSSSMKGLKAGSSLLLEGGDITVNSADDAIHSNASASITGGTFQLASGDDAVHAEETLAVSGGSITITESYEGLEALHVAVSGGTIKMKATDDGINAAGGTDDSGSGGRDTMFGGGGFGGHGGSSNGSVVIAGGTLYIRSSGDAIDANGTLEITGGHTTTTGPTSGDTTVLDYDKTGTISDGTFIGTGSSMMAQSIDGDGQGVLAFSANQSAGTTIVVQDKQGNTLIDHAPELEYAIVIISSPDIQAGETYTVTVGTQEFQMKAE